MTDDKSGSPVLLCSILGTTAIQVFELQGLLAVEFHPENENNVGKLLVQREFPVPSQMVMIHVNNCEDYKTTNCSYVMPRQK